MKKKETPLVDEHLLFLQGLQETGTDDFFYTRLRARMERKQEEKTPWSFGLKPVWVIAGMTILLLVNGYMLMSEYKAKHTRTSASSPIEQFASSYDQTIATTY